MRDILRDKKYFDTLINTYERINDIRLAKIEASLDNPVELRFQQLGMMQHQLRYMCAKYSAGYEVKDIVGNLQLAVHYAGVSWQGSCKFHGKKGEELDQYSLENYDRMLWMLSLAFLFRIPEKEFMLLIIALDGDKVRDKLFEFLITAMYRERKATDAESYKYGWVLFGKIRKAITVDCKKEAEKLMEEYLNKDWYKEHKTAAWHNTHKSKADSYHGYWCFEAAAVTCILDLDDSTYRDNQYYPKDIVDYYRSNN